MLLQNHHGPVPEAAGEAEQRLPDVGLCAAVSSQLVLGEVGVMGGRDEIVCKRVRHVLVNSGMLCVEHTVLLGQHVHGESVGSHELVLLSCTAEKEHAHFSKGRGSCTERQKYTQVDTNVMCRSLLGCHRPILPSVCSGASGGQN